MIKSNKSFIEIDEKYYSEKKISKVSERKFYYFIIR